FRFRPLPQCGPGRMKLDHRPGIAVGVPSGSCPATPLLIRYHAQAVVNWVEVAELVWEPGESVAAGFQFEEVEPVLGYGSDISPDSRPFHVQFVDYPRLREKLPNSRHRGGADGVFSFEGRGH